MKKGKDKIKEIPKIMKRTRGSIINKQTNQSEPDPWKEIRLKLKPLSKVYSDFRAKRKIAKQKEGQKRLKEQEEQRINEEEARRLEKQNQMKLKKQKRLKDQEERSLKGEEDSFLKEIKIKKEREERKKQARIYKERLAKGEQERLIQLAKVRKSKEEEKKLIDERNLMREKSLKEKEQRLKGKEEQRLKGRVKWFNGAKGYGFLETANKGKDVFVHSLAVRDAGLKYLNTGDELTFEVQETDKGPSAINLQKIS